MKSLFLAIAGVLLSALPCIAQDNVDGFVGRIYKNARGEKLPYRLFIPQAYDRNRSYPMVLWLHGADGLGTDNLQQIVGDRAPGSHLWTLAENQSKYPAFVLAPQSPLQSVEGWASTSPTGLSRSMQLTLELLESLKAEFHIDANRLYVGGQSAGGLGTWDLITKNPRMFAAAVIFCGRGFPDRAATVTKMPIWVFQGDNDGRTTAVSREMIAAIRTAGGNPKYTEYKDVRHDVWNRAVKEPGLVDWLFTQHKQP